MIRNRIVQTLLILIAAFGFSTPLVLADNSNIPGEYEPLYHRLLEQKQRFMDDRAESIRSLNEADSYLNQIDKAMINTAISVRQRLIDSRAKLVAVKAKCHKDMDYYDEQLLAIEKDLAWLEGEMKHFACMK